MQIRKIFNTYCPINRENVLKGVKAISASAASVASVITRNNPILGIATGIKITLRFRSVSLWKQEIEAPPFQRIKFNKPWKRVYLPLFNKFKRLGVFSSENKEEWAKSMSKFIDTHDIWFDDGHFHIGKKSSETNNDIQTFYALLSLAYGCLEENNFQKASLIDQLLIQPFSKKVSSQAILVAYWPFQVKLNNAKNRLYNETINDDFSNQNLKTTTPIKIQQKIQSEEKEQKSYEIGDVGKVFDPSFSFERIEIIPPFQRIFFEEPWKSVFHPLYKNLIKLEVISEKKLEEISKEMIIRVYDDEFKKFYRKDELNWIIPMSKFLETHDIWFEKGRFHIGEKRNQPIDDIQTFYALISLAYGCYDPNNKRKMTIIHQLLIRPFAKRVPLKVLQNVYWPFQAAIFRAKNALFDNENTFNDWDTQDPKTIEAIKIQRAYRRHRSRKKLYEFPYRPYSTYSFSSLKFIPSIPKISRTVNNEKAQEWIHAHEVEFQETAQKFIQFIRHISFKKFIKRLEISVESFNFYLGGLPEDQQKFVIVIPYPTNFFKNKWVTELALPMFRKPPEDVILSNQINDFRHQFPEIKRFVILDDTAFVEDQLKQAIFSYRGINYPDLKGDPLFFLIVPFMTHYATRYLSMKNIWISQHEKMLNAEELFDLGYFTQKEKSILRKQANRGIGMDLRVLITFDHKVEKVMKDFIFHSILNEGALICDKDSESSKITFIPNYSQSDLPNKRRMFSRN